MAFCTHCGSPVEGVFCPKCGAKIDAPSVPSAPLPQVPPVSSPIVIPAPPATASKKGRFIFWALGGCLLLIVIAVIVVFSTGLFIFHKTGFDAGLMQKNPGLAVAKMLASSNPDIEVLSIDEDRGIIRVRDKKTGKTLSMDWKDAQNGKVVFLDDQNRRVEIQSRGEGSNATLEIQSSEGTVRMGSNAAGRLPNWLPAYPGAEPSGAMAFDAQKGNAGSCSFKSKDSVESVAKFYESALKSAGFNVEKSVNQTAGQGAVAMISGSDNKTQRTANVSVTHSEEGTTINLAFEGK